MKVYLAPTFPEGSFYQELLIQHLRDQGAEIIPVDRRKRFFPTCIQLSSDSILHLHWLHPYFGVPFSANSNLLKKLLYPATVLRVRMFMLGLMIAKLFGVKVVWTAHNLKNHESIYPNLDYLCTQFVAKNADVIISHCDIARELIVDYFGLTDGQKIITVPHGNYIGHYDNLTTSDEARAQLNLDAESVVYLFLGFIRPYKGVYELIDAFKKNNQAGAKLLIAGKTLNDEITRQLHARIDGNENIILHPGFVPDEKIQTYMNACDIVVLPYRDILTSGAAILAMSFAKAVIAVRIGCIGDVIKEGAGGFLYSKDNQEGLSEAMLKAYEAKEQLASMGKFNYEMCETWDWHSIAAQTIQAYQSA